MVLHSIACIYLIELVLLQVEVSSRLVNLQDLGRSVRWRIKLSLVNQVQEVPCKFCDLKDKLNRRVKTRQVFLFFFWKHLQLE